MENPDPVQDALTRSARTLDNDPAVVPTQEFRRRGRVALLEAMQPSRRLVRASASRRLAAMGVATLLFGTVAMPAFASQGTLVEGVTGFADTVVEYALGLERGDEVVEDPDSAVRPAAPGELIAGLAGELVDDVETEVETETADVTGAVEREEVATDAIESEVDPATLVTHGTTVAAVAQGELLEGLSRGELVREAARDNHGQQVAAIARGELLESNSHGELVSAVAEQRQDAVEIVQETHGAAVSEVAQTNTGDGTHGETVSAVAQENHGQDVSEVAGDAGPPVEVPAAEQAGGGAAPVEVPAGPPAAADNGARGR